MKLIPLTVSKLFAVIFKLFSSLLLLFGCFGFQKVYPNIDALPKEDRLRLERFFEWLIRENVFGFTLFGEKPISIAGIFLSVQFEPEFNTVHKGWETWLNYRHLFSDDHFVLKREIYQDELVSFYLLNKQAIFKTLQKNLDLFQSIFGSQFDPEKFLNELCYSNRSLAETAKTEAVYGILLGYGKENSLDFQKEKEIAETLSALKVPPLAGQKTLQSVCHEGKKYIELLSPSSPPKRKYDCFKLVNEFNEITQNRKSFELEGNDLFLEKFNSPGFVCWDKNPETEELKKNYSQIRAILSEAYKKGSFLEITFHKWINPRR